MNLRPLLKNVTPLKPSAVPLARENGLDLDGQDVEVGLDCLVAGRDLRLESVVLLQVLAQDKEVFGSVVPSESRRDLLSRGLASGVAVAGQVLGVRLSLHDVAQDPLPGSPGDVREHDVQLQVHLHQCLLHAVDRGRSALDERFTVPEVGPQGGDLRGRTEAAPEQPDAVKLLQPLAVAAPRAPGSGGRARLAGGGAFLFPRAGGIGPLL